MQVAIRSIPSILTPFAREDTLPRCIGWHRWDRVSNEGELLGFIQPCTSSFTGGKELVHERCVYGSYRCLSVDDEADRDAEHGEKVGVNNGPVQGVNTPCWIVADEIVSRCSFGIRFFPEKSECQLVTRG